MKALIISYSFPPGTRGAPTLMYNLCKYLPKKSFHVITTVTDLAISSGDYDKKYILDCSPIRLPVRTYNMRDGLKFFLLTILHGLLLNKKGEVECVLAVYPYEFDLYAAYILHQLTGKPLIIYMHDLFSEVKREAGLYRIWKFVEKKIFSAASAIIVTNEKFKEHYSREGIRNVVVLESCVDLNEEDPEAISQRILPSKRNLRIVFTGLVYAANEDAILCFLEAAKKISDIEIMFATASGKDYLTKVSIGFLSKKECSKLQRSADVLLLPLSFKNPYPEEIKCAFPCKALEYLAAGKPILAIAPKGSFMEEFIERNEVGIVVTELSEEKISDAIEKLKDEENRKNFSKNALKTVLLFDARIQAKRLYSLIEHVVSNNNSNRAHFKDAMEEKMAGRS